MKKNTNPEVPSAMAVTWKNVLYGLGLISLCFVGIPVRIKDDLEQQFQEFLRQHNKSYVNNPSEMERRFDIFKVSFWASSFIHH